MRKIIAELKLCMYFYWQVVKYDFKTKRKLRKGEILWD